MAQHPAQEPAQQQQQQQQQHRLQLVQHQQQPAQQQAQQQRHAWQPQPGNSSRSHVCTGSKRKAGDLEEGGRPDPTLSAQP